MTFLSSKLGHMYVQAELVIWSQYLSSTVNGDITTNLVLNCRKQKENRREENHKKYDYEL